VVAGGRIWTSAGVVRHSHEFMPQQSYIVCDHCQRVDIRLKYAEHPKGCEQCRSRLKWGARRPQRQVHLADRLHDFRRGS
jgi:hypothetical protein